ncbi:STE3-domain-containing protein [Auriscalpium vulgare]|uniref:STE3-domain-containing protein n=1 Tax=Auriscalpium vulgare TaxID=40419 RepID=A0ACB8SB22_9AGAM|nr:STE3-domain-containing protein [Auriscalpium vulgare]
MQYAYLPAAALIAAVLSIIPITWQWRARNIPTTSLCLWLFVTNIIYAVNTIVWAGNVALHSAVWCDISTKVMIGSQVALPAATVCIARMLWSLASGRHSTQSKRFWMWVDIAVCVGAPVLVMILHYIVQGHRFDIVENFGCEPAVYFSIPSIFILSFLPLLFSAATLVFSALAFYFFMRRRIEFATFLSGSGSSLTPIRYIRLMLMAVLLAAWNGALTAYNVDVNTAPGLRPWTNWDDVHSDFSRVDLYASLLLPASFRRNLMLFWWAVPVSAYLAFAFFGLGEEAFKEYRKLGRWIARRVLRRQPSLPSYSSPSAARYPLKSFLSSSTTLHNDSLDRKKDISLPLVRAPSSTTTLPQYSPSSPSSSSASPPPSPHKVLPFAATAHPPIQRISLPLPSPLPSTPSTARWSLASVAHARVNTPPPQVARPQSVPEDVGLPDSWTARAL